jgi:hypothetical protein
VWRDGLVENLQHQPGGGLDVVFSQRSQRYLHVHAGILWNGQRAIEPAFAVSK